MSNRGKPTRYLLILDHLQRSPSFAELKEHLAAHGIDLSPRTLQRDIEEMRAELGLDVVYDRGNNTYSVVQSGADQAVVMQLLERAQLMDLVGAGGKGARQLGLCIRFDEQGRMRGMQHLPVLLSAIQERRELNVSYRRAPGDAPKAYRMHPYLLKEYGGRWYLLGRPARNAEALAMGLEGIVTLEPLRTKFKRVEAEVAALHDHVIGVDGGEGKPERIVLRFDAQLGSSVKVRPLHPSQNVEKEDKNSCTISLHLRPNASLQQMIMGLGAAVQVLEPKHLAKSIRQAHKAAAAAYK